MFSRLRRRRARRRAPNQLPSPQTLCTRKCTAICPRPRGTRKTQFCDDGPQQTMHSKRRWPRGERGPRKGRCHQVRHLKSLRHTSSEVPFQTTTILTRRLNRFHLLHQLYLVLLLLLCVRIVRQYLRRRVAWTQLQAGSLSVGKRSKTPRARRFTT